MKYTAKQLKEALEKHPDAHIILLEDAYPKARQVFKVSDEGIRVDFLSLKGTTLPNGLTISECFATFYYTFDAYGKKWKIKDESILKKKKKGS